MITIAIKHTIPEQLRSAAVFFKATGGILSAMVGAKRRGLLFVLLHLLLLPTALCSAASQQIQVTWDYSGATADLAGFRLYQDASPVPVCESNDPAARTLTCTVDLGGASALFTMTAFDNNGAESSQSTAFTLTPPVVNQAPIAVAEANVLSGPAPLAVFFNGSASTDPEGNIASYAWNFGDGSSGVGVAVDHTYTLPGLYSVSLTVSDDSGASATSSVLAINVTGAVASNQPPAAHLTASTTSGVAPLAVTFDGRTSSDADGSIASYAWNFGDGGLGSGSLVSHSFMSGGSYTVTLTVTDNQGATDDVQTVIVVQAPAVNQPPSAVLTTNVATGTAPLEVVFNGSGSSDQDGTIASYSWNFGDGSSGSGSTSSHTYWNAGQYNVTLTVTDNQGATAHTSTLFAVTEVQAGNKTPIANFSVNMVSNQNAPQVAVLSTDYLTVVFDGTISSDEDGDIVGYLWDFGDGQTGSGPTVTHTYAEPNSYAVTLSVVDNEGAIASIQKIISLNDAAVALAASFSTAVNTELRGVLAATDPQGFELVYTITSQARKGTAMLLDPATGEFVYTPQAGVNGTDSFSFKASSNGLDSNIATVSIIITTPKSLSAPAPSSSTTSAAADAGGGGGGGGCSLAMGQRSPKQAADWFLLGSCFVWLAVRKLQRR